MNDIPQSLQHLIGIFERLGLPYAVMGGVAVRAYGIPRATYDVDFTLAIPRERLSELYDAVEDQGYTVADNFRSGWVDQVGGMPLIKFRIYTEKGGVDADVFLSESRFLQSAIQRRRFVETDDGSVWLVSPEDLVLLKLVAYRPRDVADMLDVLFTQGQLEEEYMRGWATKLGVENRLDELLEQHRGMI